MAYTYDDFVSAANSAGLLKQFTDSDLQIAQKNPEFGLSMLGVLKDGNSASTAEQKLLATEAANQLRKTYGSFGQITPYSGTYDTQIKELIDKTNNYGAFQYGGQNAYQQALDRVTNYGDFQYDGQNAYDQTLDKLNNYGSFQYSGQNAYQQALDKVANYGEFQYGDDAAYQEMLKGVINSKGFQYNPESDPTWSAYKKASLREGERASANALAQASAASGGRASSYALTAAQQAANYYASQLGDMLPTLQQNAYQQYLSEFEKKLSSLGALESDRSFEYQQFLNGLNQAQGALSALQGDRNTNYEEWLNRYDMLQNNLNVLQSDRNFAYQAHLNGLSQAQSALNALQSDRNTNYEEWLNNFNMLQTALGNLQSQNQTEYQRYLNALEMAQQSQQEAYNRAYHLQQDKLQQEQLAYEKEQAQQKYADQQAQQKYANALALYETLGYATPEIAEILGIPAGTGSVPGNTAPSVTDIPVTNVPGTALLESGILGALGPAQPNQVPVQTKPLFQNSTDFSNESLTTEQIKQMQKYFGVEADGMWSNQSAAAAGGRTAQQAWDYYHELTKEPGDVLGEDMQSILDLGYGPISAARLEELIVAGEVEEYVENGMYKYRRVKKSPTSTVKGSGGGGIQTIRGRLTTK
ncbi:MAG: hypothetical protein IJF02_03440 [Oscillospiraceae bacterium]|nr:hypothetical protein [Oscillospiraceae bacterium]